MIPRCLNEVWFLDTEFSQADGEQPRPICAVARELFTGRVVSRWLWGEQSPRPPFETGPDVLVVCYSAPAEWSVYLALGWPLPSRILDLYAEYRWLMSGFKMPGYGQLDAMSAFGLPCMDEFFKSDMRSLCIRGGPYGADESRQILDYCQDDVEGLAALFDKMADHIQWPQALARGRYTAAVARIEALGVPLDVELYADLHAHRRAIRGGLIDEMASEFGIYDEERFDSDSFDRYLRGQGIPWPRTPTGRLVTRSEVFEETADVYPQLRPLVELRSALNQLKDDGGFTVGADGRNRTPLRPFATSSGRNAPSTTKFIFGKSVAFRHLIRPEPGWALAYIDWGQQEFGIAAVLSDDHNMRQAYLSGDPYLEFAKQAGAVPSSATKQSHGEVRELFKTCMLGVNYSMGPLSLARRIGRPLPYAQELLQLHRQVYRRYWRWVEQVQDQAMITGRLQTCFGWQVNVSREANPRSLKNFPMQGTGSELLRLACCLATERGVRVVAPVHDAVLIEAPTESIGEAAKQMQAAMNEASAAALDGFVLRADDPKIVRHPDRYQDGRGAAFWSLLLGLLAKAKSSPCTPSSLYSSSVFIETLTPFTPPTPSPHPCTPPCHPSPSPHPEVTP